ncbi:MAG TPA: 3-methyl-2-oxobutanoate hydroxymethyltransferase, partial [Gammaproteobacteria bacterium]|nr:3-methyl-2-oxobutanoate hydroxymethyltransferase [Gammaproteobacteria bacterium]
MSQITITKLQQLKSAGEKIAVLTAYDASIAALADDAGMEVILVGDSLGMVVQGHDSTLPVTTEQMAYHTSCVARGVVRALLIADLPFMTYADRSQAVASAKLLMQAGAQMVKLEGGDVVLDAVSAISDQGAPVCAHLGLTPQSVHRLGGYRVQGRGAQAADELL